MDGPAPRRPVDLATLVVGVVVLLAGLALLLRSAGLGTPPLAEWWRWGRTLSGSLALVVLGVMVFVAAGRPSPRVIMPDRHRRLCRSRTDRVVTGVCGGIAEYLRTDPTLVRLAWVAAALAFGLGQGLVAYVLATWVMPYGPAGPTPDTRPAR